MWGEKIKYHLITYFLSNIPAKTYQHRPMYLKLIGLASNISVVLGIQCSRIRLHIQRKCLKSYFPKKSFNPFIVHIILYIVCSDTENTRTWGDMYTRVTKTFKWAKTSFQSRHHTLLFRHDDVLTVNKTTFSLDIIIEQREKTLNSTIANTWYMTSQSVTVVQLAVVW